MLTLEERQAKAKARLDSYWAAKNKKPTNADRIRAMTDEELKEWFCQQRECDDWHCPYCNNYVFGAERCGLRDWLKSPVEVDE